MRTFFLAFIVSISMFSDDFNYAPRIIGAKEKSLVVCVASYNNEQFYHKNLDSIFSQRYTNFRVIYIDDGSTDKTYDLVRDYVESKNLTHKVSLLRNEQNQGAMYNHVRMANMCYHDEIVITLDGDDWFSTDKALERINEAYTDPNVWMTYGSFICFPKGKWEPPGIETLSNLARKSYRRRNAYFKWSHLRTYYAELFKNVPLDYFYDSTNKYCSVSCDVAIMLSLLDLAQGHARYIPDVLCIYNNSNPLSDGRLKKEEQIVLEQYFKEKKPLNELEFLDFEADFDF